MDKKTRMTAPAPDNAEAVRKISKILGGNVDAAHVLAKGIIYVFYLIDDSGGDLDEQLDEFAKVILCVLDAIAPPEETPKSETLETFGRLVNLVVGEIAGPTAEEQVRACFTTMVANLETEEAAS